MSSKDPTREQAVAKLAELIGKIRIAMLTTVSADGSLWSRPITTQRSHFDGNLWFITRRTSPKVSDLEQQRRVSLSYVEGNAYVSVSGVAQVLTDPDKARELWSDSYRQWFPKGADDPELALIRVNVERAEYWDAPALTWPTEAGFVVTAPEQLDNPQYHARIVFKKD